MPSTRISDAGREVTAIKGVLSKRLKRRLKERGGSVASLARELGTSRTSIQRVLDPENTSITLRTMVRTAHSLGYRLQLKMEPRVERIERMDAPGETRKLMNKLGKALDKIRS